MAFGTTEIDAIFDAEFAGLDEPLKAALIADFKTFANSVNTETTLVLAESVRIALIEQWVQSFSQELEGELKDQGPIEATPAINAAVVTIPFDRNIDAQLPTTDLFTFTIDGVETTVTSVQANGAAQVNLTLTTAATAGQAVLMTAYDGTVAASQVKDATSGKLWKPLLPMTLTNNTV